MVVTLAGQPIAQIVTEEPIHVYASGLLRITSSPLGVRNDVSSTLPVVFGEANGFGEITSAKGDAVLTRADHLGEMTREINLPVPVHGATLEEAGDFGCHKWAHPSMIVVTPFVTVGML